MASITLKNVVKKYHQGKQSLQVIHGVDADIADGEFIVIVGPSGCGKSTLLNCIAGLEPITGGAVRIGGQDMTHVSPKDRNIAMVFQNYALYPHMSVFDNMAYGLKIARRPADEIKVRVDKAANILEIGPFLDRKPRELSGGQRQRVALARAIARRPAVLLLDEPFSAVDRSTRKRLYVELRRLHEQLQNTIVLVTHDLDEAAQLASHLYLVRHGRLLQSGPTPEVLTRPCCEQSARLLDIPNIFSGQLEGRSEDHWLMRWGPHLLRVTGLREGQTPGPLRWAVLPSNVLLARPDKPWSSQLENPVPARVCEVIELGGEAVVHVEPEGLPGALLQLRLPTRAVRRYEVEPGHAIIICLRSADIVPLQDDRSANT